MDSQSSGIPLLTPGNEVVEVGGEEVTPEEFHSAGGCWKPVLLKARAENKALNLTAGLNVRKEDRVLVQRSIQRDDAFRFNEEQNTLIVSTPALESAVNYGGVHSLNLKGQTYEVVAYAILPDDTINGVIHGIPDKDSEQDVLNNLVTARNQYVLHARPMGRSKSAVVLFKG
ncbi:hypothetical protein HPB47_012578 [Ixodes persulcatus]|uniref:Uncharacterized protein n=1 Tax=Ixodes persulcatus TaxID=34615 RepID=A0AC60NT46_IXOPE|nr:hypothetical protein HPB47_012578 [Ixodes persulcatus]